MNPASRVSDVKQLESLFYQRVPEVTLLYPNVLEAYRSDRFAPFTVQPQPGGVIMAQNGYWGYYSATPLAATGSTGSGGDIGTIIWIVVAVIVVLGVGVIVVVRRRAGTADRE
jgi:peptide/nickel transport system substrate-binding protein